MAFTVPTNYQVYQSGPVSYLNNDGSQGNVNDSVQCMDGQALNVPNQQVPVLNSPANSGGQNSSTNSISLGTGASENCMNGTCIGSNHGSGTVYRVCIACILGQLYTIEQQQSFWWDYNWSYTY